MKKFKVEIEELLQRVVEIEANTVEEAISIAQDEYRKEKYVLSDSDFKEVNFYEFKEVED